MQYINDLTISPWSNSNSIQVRKVLPALKKKRTSSLKSDSQSVSRLLKSPHETIEVSYVNRRPRRVYEQIRVLKRQLEQREAKESQKRNPVLDKKVEQFQQLGQSVLRYEMQYRPRERLQYRIRLSPVFL